MLNHLPASVQDIAADQGWNDLSIGILLLGFIADNVPDYESKLAAYCQAVADEENAG